MNFTFGARALVFYPSFSPFGPSSGTSSTRFKFENRRSNFGKVFDESSRRSSRRRNERVNNTLACGWSHPERDQDRRPSLECLLPYFSEMLFFTSLTPVVFLAISAALSFCDALSTNPLSCTVPWKVVTFTSGNL